MKCDLSMEQRTNDNRLRHAWVEMIRSPFDLAPITPGTKEALALAAELAPYFDWTTGETPPADLA
jgi:hypothetical protein